MVSFLLLIEAKFFCVFRKMEKSEFQAVIKHLYLNGLTPKEIKAELDEVHGISAPVFATVYNWVIVYDVPRRIMRVITRRATMLAGDRSQGVVEA